VSEIAATIYLQEGSYVMNVDKINKYVEKGNFDKLIDIAGGKDLEMSLAAITALANIKKDESFNFMVNNLHNSNKQIRLAVIAGMGNLAMARGKTHLRHLADTDQDKEIVAAANDAIVKLFDAR
jgi:hypothetical protein